MLAIFISGVAIGIGIGIALIVPHLNAKHDFELEQSYQDGLFDGGMIVSDLELELPIGHAAKFSERN